MRRSFAIITTFVIFFGFFQGLNVENVHAKMHPNSNIDCNECVQKMPPDNYDCCFDKAREESFPRAMISNSFMHGTSVIGAYVPQLLFGMIDVPSPIISHLGRVRDHIPLLKTVQKRE